MAVNYAEVRDQLDDAKRDNALLREVIRRMDESLGDIRKLALIGQGITKDSDLRSMSLGKF